MHSGKDVPAYPLSLARRSRGDRHGVALRPGCSSLESRCGRRGDAHYRMFISAHRVFVRGSRLCLRFVLCDGLIRDDPGIAGATKYNLGHFVQLFRDTRIPFASNVSVRLFRLVSWSLWHRISRDGWRSRRHVVPIIFQILLPAAFVASLYFVDLRLYRPGGGDEIPAWKVVVQAISVAFGGPLEGRLTTLSP